MVWGEEIPGGKRMKLRSLLLMVSVLCLFVLAPASVLSQGPTVTAGCGAATIDGVMSPGEWDNATRVELTALANANGLPEWVSGAGSSEVAPAQNASSRSRTTRSIW